MPDTSFVAVDSRAQDADAPPPTLPPPPPGERRHGTRARRLHDAAIDEALAAWPTGVAAAALLLLAQAAAGARDAWAWAAVATAAGLACALAARRVHRLGPQARRAHPGRLRACAALAVCALLLVALAPWLARGAAPHATGVTWALALLAPLLALALAPLGAAAAALAALPLSHALALALAPAVATAPAPALGPALAPALAPVPAPALAPALPPALGTGLAWHAAPDTGTLVAACCATAALTLAVAWLAHRRWRRLRLALMDRGDALRQRERQLAAAQQADREKSRFLAIASHDLRQPVHALGLFAGTLERRLQGTEQEPLVRNVMRSIDGLERSFNAMLDISRLDAGTVEPNVQHFPLRDVFRRLHMQYAGQAESSGLGLRFSPGGKSVSSDPQLLERILGNLVQNALRYTARGGVVVVARSVRTHIHVEVWDTGVGIGPVDLPRIFEEFYQCGRNERNRTQGLGMGLAIVKRLAHLLGHGLTVSSRPGRGTVFRVAIALGGLAEIRDATAAADTQPMPVLQARTVLVVDDEEAIREGLRILLEEWGYAVVCAASAEGAQHAAATMELPPDLIVSDLHLGGGPDGIAAIAAVRRQCGYEVPAIVVTGDTAHEEIQRAADAGHTVLVKPLQARKLLAALRGMVP